MLNRTDLTDWVTHFIHDRHPQNDPRWDEDRRVYLPYGFDESGTPEFSEPWDDADDQYPVEEEVPAFQVLLKILDDGHIRAGWSYRKGRPTIYGPSPAVCFTEMPLYALREYAAWRAEKDKVSTYGIAVRKAELFRSGGRPVIYGLSGNAHEARSGDINYGKGLRSLDSSSALGLPEQYRYVATVFGGGYNIDWMHEREWRWPYRYEEQPDVPGLSLWLKDVGNIFSEIIVLVQTNEEGNRVLDAMAHLEASQHNRLGLEVSKKRLRNTRVMVLDQLPTNLGFRLEDIESKQLQLLTTPVVTPEIERLVSQEVHTAAAIATSRGHAWIASAPKTSQGYVADVCGFAWVVTYETRTAVTAALMQGGFAEPRPDGAICLKGIPSGISDQSLTAREVAAQAAADHLTAKLGQEFFVSSRMD